MEQTHSAVLRAPATRQRQQEPHFPSGKRLLSPLCQTYLEVSCHYRNHFCTGWSTKGQVLSFPAQFANLACCLCSKTRAKGFDPAAAAESLERYVGQAERQLSSGSCAHRWVVCRARSREPAWDKGAVACLGKQEDRGKQGERVQERKEHTSNT